jgi:hypothetical protein
MKNIFTRLKSLSLSVGLLIIPNMLFAADVPHTQSLPAGALAIPACSTADKKYLTHLLKQAPL